MGVARSSTRQLSLDLRAFARVIKEGPLLKQSHHLKQWRQRTVVLTPHKLVTFPQKTPSCKENLPSTLQVRISDIESLRKYESNGVHYIQVTAFKRAYLFKASSEQNCEEWYSAIKRLKVGLPRARSYSAYS